MKFENYKPSGLLKLHIENYTVVQTDRVVSTSVVPEPTPVLSFRTKGEHNYWRNGNKFTLPPCAITGLRTSVKPIDLSENTETILVKFKPCEAALFFNEPQHLFFNQSVSLYDFLPNEIVSTLAEQLAGKRTHLQKINILERFLLSSLRNKRAYTLIKIAVQKIITTKGSVRIKELAATLNVSMDAFEKQFREIAGMSPKRFSSLIRLVNLTGTRFDKQSLADIAYEYGYFDQSHFIKAFKQFTGRTPLDYYRAI